MKRILTLIFLTVLLMPMMAQKIGVEGFKKVKKDLLNQTPLPVDKKQATLDFLTDEKGFTFKANGTVDVQAEEGDGKITILTPHKTKFVLIKHPDYGQYTWKVPGKGLKKKKHYQANLLSDKPGKEYKLSKQWVVFQVDPENAIVQVDSTTILTRDGKAQFNVTIGKHPYRVDSPFHEVVEDTLEVTDSVKLFMPVVLQSFYSYLTVKSPMIDAVVFIDGQPIGKGGSTSGHLYMGDHRLQIYRLNECFYDSIFHISKSEKKIIELTATDLRPRPQIAKLAVAATQEEVVKADSVAVEKDTLTIGQPQWAEVTITAPDDSTQILLNREPMALGKWEGRLELGYYTVNTLKDGLESKTIPFWVDDTLPKLLDLSAPQASYGLLNVHSNVIGATVKVNGVVVGQTPCVVENLPASKECQVLLTKRGYFDAQAVLTPIGNDMLDVELKMRKR